ncbi:hypothetical protein [Oscillibacter sp.]|uniref:hypothetical protein n=1 Tax=Oscillibacter sp. TaxID=1945593 RepID=UPI0028A11FEA|nr:hypothetical protein [Oscillibacter sp.]
MEQKMNPDEIIRALRCCGNTDTKRPDCEHCPANGYMCVKRMLEGAADLLESQQSRIAELEGITFWAQNRYLKEQLADLEAELLQKTNEADGMRSNWYKSAESYQQKCRDMAELEAQLAASRHRERAAVEDMKRIVDAVRGEHGGEICCFACAYDADTSITDSGAHANELRKKVEIAEVLWGDRAAQAGEGGQDG